MKEVAVTQIAIVGGGPAGLMAAETIASARRDLRVTVYDRMPRPGRKLLLAGRGGLNLTHGEGFDAFVQRYGEAAGWMRPLLERFTPQDAIRWCEGLGQATFVGSSGRVFPRAMKASPLLRAWLRRLEGLGVRFAGRAAWRGWDDAGDLVFDGADPVAGTVRADATVLALGGASWPRLGSDGGWTGLLPGIRVAPLRPANCGFVVPWSDKFRARHAGSPLKRIALSFAGRTLRGEAMIAAKGIEGGAVYQLAAALRDAIGRDGGATLEIDLRPDLDAAQLAAKLATPRGGASLSTYLAKRLGLSPVAIGLVQEALHGDQARTPLPVLVKALALRLDAPFALDRAISTAGGIALHELDERLMLKRKPGVFACGEMLDWEAPTGGYLLQACLATGAAAGRGVLAWLERPS